MTEWLNLISPCPRIVGSAPAPSGWIEPMRHIYEHELVLFEKASYDVEIEDKRFHCRPGAFIIIPPAKKHITINSDHRPGFRYWVHFDWVYSKSEPQRPIMTYAPARPQKEFYHKPPSFLPMIIMHGEILNFKLMLERIKRMEHLFNLGDKADQMACRGILLEILMNLLAKDDTRKIDGIHKSMTTEYDLASQVRRQLFKLADRPANEPVMLQKYLEQSGLSYPHQCRVFKKCYGLTPLQYVTQLRITRAKLLIRDCRYSVSEIAKILGYDNLSYFSRIFKNETGYNPTMYRNIQ